MKQLTKRLQVLTDSLLLEVAVSGVGCGFAFQLSDSPKIGPSKKNEKIWVWFEGNSWFPILLPLSALPNSARKPALPLQLFLKSHFVGRTLVQIEHLVEKGRALRWVFSKKSEKVEFEKKMTRAKIKAQQREENLAAKIEFNLWPHGGNVVAYANDMHMVWDKSRPAHGVNVQKELKPVVEYPQLNTDQSEGSSKVRSLEELVVEWRNSRPGGATSQSLFNKKGETPDSLVKKQAEAAWKKERERLIRAIKKVEEEIKLKSESPWREVGNWIVTHQSLQTSANLQSFVDMRRSKSWNIENAFMRAKELERKLKVTQDRLSYLNQQLTLLEEEPDQQKWYENFCLQKPSAKINPNKNLAKSKNAVASKIRYHTVALSSEVQALVGKSASDNLALLRRARAWDLWLHLRDFPGSHALIFRPKKHNISIKELKKTLKVLVQQTFGVKAKNFEGEKFDLIVVECRFVRPIKGSAGKVTFTHEKVFTVEYTLSD
ncbi:MAG: hypothetical protein K1X29_10295 [Bdellovibrionales bacterium]|nr:hypothetical protein [Bdellovibrionales bacterium]